MFVMAETERNDSINSGGVDSRPAEHGCMSELTPGPVLSTIGSPADLRRFPVEALGAVCADIRDFLIRSLSDNPGFCVVDGSGRTDRGTALCVQSHLMTVLYGT